MDTRIHPNLVQAFVIAMALNNAFVGI